MKVMKSQLGLRDGIVLKHGRGNVDVEKPYIDALAFG